MKKKKGWREVGNRDGFPAKSIWPYLNGLLFPALQVDALINLVLVLLGARIRRRRCKQLSSSPYEELKETFLKILKEFLWTETLLPA